MTGLSKKVRNKIISAGAKNLREFGYVHCNKDNILTDEIYKEFFKRMLQDNMGQGADEYLEAILKEIG